MDTTPLWFDATLPEAPVLAEDLEVDVAVVGGGIAGLTAAVLLARAGRRVALLTAQRLGEGDSGHTTAHLTEILDARWTEIEKSFGRDGSRRVADSIRASIDRIEAFSVDDGIPSEFRRLDAWLYGSEAGEEDSLREEAAAAARAGLRASYVDRAPAPFGGHGAVRIERQADFHPLRHLAGLARLFVEAGGRAFQHSPVRRIEDGEPVVLETDGHRVRARTALLCTHSVFHDRMLLHSRVAAYRTYVVAGPAPETVPDGLFWDTEDPYHYVRTVETSHGRQLVVGGEDHKTGQTRDTGAPFRKLERWARDRFGLEVTRRWSGQVLNPVDGLPYIGRNPLGKNVLVATGFSGTGMTFGTLAGMMLANQALGLPSPWADLYSPERVKPLASARTFVEENVDYPLHLLLDRIAPAEARDLRDVPPGQGRLCAVEGRKVAAYREEWGALVLREARCPHAGCLVQWNGAETSWDCPCHGSRFDPRGKLLNGPATDDLAPAALEAPADDAAAR